MLLFRPSARTAGFVERYTIVESDDEATRVLLPEPGLHLGVRYRGAATMIEGDRAMRLTDLVVTGLRDSSRTMRTHAGGGIVVALFRPTGAAAMFRAPLHELFGATVPLDALVSPREAQVLAERVGAPVDHTARVAALEEFLAARLATPRTDPLVDRAVDALVASRGTVRIGALADELDLGQDALEKRFRRMVGGTPKQLASILRVRHAIELGSGGQPWSTVAHRAGYFDQSHFIREFRGMTGRSPARFFREVEHCVPNQISISSSARRGSRPSP